MQPYLTVAALAGLIKRRELAVAVLRQSRMIWASPALLAMFGLESGAAAGRKFLELVAEEDRATLAGALDETPGAESPPTAFRGLRADGSQFDGELVSSAFDLPGGAGAVITVNDVTEPRRALTCRTARCSSTGSVRCWSMRAATAPGSPFWSPIWTDSRK